ncbi:MAG: fibrillarin-like rRNA/tRNA 2'-O-methyltransferase [Candidatus Woesearchaeota archaeon]
MISKLKAIRNHGIDVRFNGDEVILYLGASHGVTAKMIADEVKQGFVFCLDISPDSMIDLLRVCEENENMAPMLYDANRPEDYEKKIPKVDFIYQDLAQKDQAGIFIKNAERFLKAGGKFILIIKAMSIDSARSLKEVIGEVKQKLKGYSLTDISLERTHRGHYAIIGEKNGKAI